MMVRVAATAEAAAEVAAGMIARRLRSAVARRGQATVAFSGGSTPALMLALMAQMALPWDSIEVFQVDERIAPIGHPDRNGGLLAALPIRRRQIHAMPVTASDLDAAARRYAARLPERLDVVHLGIGDDGHTASWPPGDPVIDSTRSVDLCGVFNGWRRMTLTPGAVNAARSRVVLAVGETKASMIERWLAGDRSLPIQRVWRTNTVLVTDNTTTSTTTSTAAPERAGRN